MEKIDIKDMPPDLLSKEQLGEWVRYIKQEVPSAHVNFSSHYDFAETKDITYIPERPWMVVDFIEASLQKKHKVHSPTSRHSFIQLILRLDNGCFEGVLFIDGEEWLDWAPNPPDDIQYFTWKDSIQEFQKWCDIFLEKEKDNIIE